MAPTRAAQPTDTTTTTNSRPNPHLTPSTANDQVAAAAAAANEWLTGAGKMWESAVKDVGSKLKSAAEGVDTAGLTEQVEVIRQRSGRLMEDMSKSVQNMNLSIDQEELQKKAEVLSTSTKQLLDQGMQRFEQGRAEALEIFVDKEQAAGSSAGVPPWDEKALPENESAYSDALRKEMLVIVVNSIYSKKKRTDLFLSGVAEREKFEFVLEDNSGMAMAALEADRNMRRLRAGLVPGKMKEEEFWRTYFYHVHRVRQTLLANHGVMPETEGEDVDEDPATLFGDDGDGHELDLLDSPSRTAEKDGTDGTDRMDAADGETNWDDEIDAAFHEEDE